MKWITLLAIGSVVAAIVPVEAADNKNDRSVETESVQHVHRMLRADAEKKAPPEKKPKPMGKKEMKEMEEQALLNSTFGIADGENSTLVVDEVENITVAVDESEMYADTNSTTELSLASNMTNTSVAASPTADETAVDEDDQYEVESFITPAVTQVTLDNAPQKRLPYFTFTITTDPGTDEIDTSKLNSVLADYLLDELQKSYPQLEDVALDIDYEYKPEKEGVDGVGFASDSVDSMHMFNATGGLYFQTSRTGAPTENEIYAKARDALSSADAEADILSLLQADSDASLSEAKTFSVSDVTPRDEDFMLEDSKSISRTMDTFIGLTAVLILLAGAYIARDNAKAIAADEDSIEDEESMFSKDHDDDETLPPTPPSTPPATTERKMAPPSENKASPALITLSDFNILDELSYMGGGDGNDNMNNADAHPQSILRSPTTRSAAPQEGEAATVATQQTSPELIKLSDFNILDELMCMGKESPTEPSRHVKFDVQSDSTNNEDTSSMHIFDTCGPVEVADGVKIDRAHLQPEPKSRTSTEESTEEPGYFDVRLGDLNVFGASTHGTSSDDDDDDDDQSETRSYSYSTDESDASTYLS